MFSGFVKFDLFHVSLPNYVALFVILLIKSAGFSAASDATKVSVIIGLFKVHVMSIS